MPSAETVSRGQPSKGSVLVLGASGLIGGACLRAFAEAGWRVSGTGSSRLAGALLPCDFAVPGQAAELVMKLRPDVVVLAAAQVNADRCETEPVAAFRSNAEAPAEVARAARETGSYLAFVSSDYVFDGRQPNREEDPVRPLGAYGRAKVAAEMAVSTLLPDHASVVRTTHCYGWERGGKNFVLQMLARVGKGERMRVVTDQVGTPTHADDVAAGLLAVSETRATGRFHAVGPESMSRIEFARRACAVFGWDPSLLDPVTTRELQQVAPRPLDNPTLNERLATLMGHPLRGVDEGLRAMRAQMESDRG